MSSRFQGQFCSFWSATSSPYPSSFLEHFKSEVLVYITCLGYSFAGDIRSKAKWTPRSRWATFSNHTWHSHSCEAPSFTSSGTSLEAHSVNTDGRELPPALLLQVGWRHCQKLGSCDKFRTWTEKASGWHVGFCFKDTTLSFSNIFTSKLSACSKRLPSRQDAYWAPQPSTPLEGPAVLQQLTLPSGTAQLP